ncbi:hypothetical protein RF55_25234 [Lasius niger]|uniref:Uncharacterized protein n=1 Tax=Lasius niger TaxID=67767 RepID=A0A0J7JU22_LASNI|nr:hypothetical protein RF55_25234 [Lasius niger]
MGEVDHQIRRRQCAPPLRRPFDQHQGRRLGQRLQSQPFQLARIGDPIQIQMPSATPSGQRIRLHQTIRRTLDRPAYPQGPQQCAGKTAFARAKLAVQIHH